MFADPGGADEVPLELASSTGVFKVRERAIQMAQEPAQTLEKRVGMRPHRRESLPREEVQHPHHTTAGRTRLPRMPVRSAVGKGNDLR